jgi:hypothetical protein
MDTLFVAIGLVGFILIVLHVLRPNPSEPQIIYIQTAPPPLPQETGIGCLPVLIVGLLMLVALGILQLPG